MKKGLKGCLFVSLGLIALMVIIALFTSKSIAKEDSITKYKTVKDLFDSGMIVSNESKLISEKPCKVKLATYINRKEAKDMVQIIQYKDMVWFVYCLFATTDVDSVDLTCTPYIVDHENPKKSGYIDKDEIHLKTTRQAAKRVMKDRLGTDDFGLLFHRKDSIDLPTEDFDKLKSVNNNYVAGVFLDLKMIETGIK